MSWLLIVSMIWAFSFGLIKNQLVGIPPVVIVFLRLFIACLVFAPFMQFKQLSWQKIMRLSAAGAIQFGLMYIAYQYSFIYLKSYEVALFTVFTPLYIAVFHGLSRGKNAMIIFGAALMAVIGTGIAVWKYLPRIEIWQGIFVVQISNFCFAFGQLYYKKIMGTIPGSSDLQVMGWLYLGGALTACLGVFILPDTITFYMTNVQILVVVYLGVVASGFGFFLWNLGARRVNNGALAVFNNLKVPLAMLVSVLIFNEQADFINLLVGGTIVSIALIINEIIQTRRKSPAAE